MQTHQIQVPAGADLAAALEPMVGFDPDLLLVFGDVDLFRGDSLHGTLTRHLPRAALAGCSTAGEITRERVDEHTLVMTGLRFESSRLSVVTTRLAGMTESLEAGRRLGAQFPREGLRHVLVFGVGLGINGSALVAGLQASVGNGVTLSGGLAGDGGAFAQTYTLGPQGSASDQIVAVGLYGQALHAHSIARGGWTPFGPVRKVTRCEDNVLYELDGVRALDLYKQYLGEHAKGLPASGLLFPFEMLREDRDSNGIIRTILGVDECAGSLTLAGDIDPRGSLRLMHASTDQLIDAAEVAGRTLGTSVRTDSHGGAALALLVSCVGRRLVMGDRVDEEVEAVVDAFSTGTVVAGFYSYGEVAQSEFFGDCRLHNQTMTITLISESV